MRIASRYKVWAWDTRASWVTSELVGMKLRFSLLGRERESLAIFVKPSSTSAHSAGVGGEKGVALGLVDGMCARVRMSLSCLDVTSQQYQRLSLCTASAERQRTTEKSMKECKGDAGFLMLQCHSTDIQILSAHFLATQ